MEAGAGPLGAGTDLGPYRLGEMLGTGGMGTVYVADVTGRAPDIEPGSRVALKVIHPHLAASEGFAARFRREAEIGMAVDHPNVVRTLDAGECDGHHYLVMEYVEGQTLHELREDLDRLPEELSRHVGLEICKALSAIHEAGAVHRDLKPENVLITPQHEVKVMDLGVALPVDEATRLSQTGAFVGSLNYAAPEQFRGGGRDLDGRVDLHALGILLYEVSTGERPFDAQEMPALIRQVLEHVPTAVGKRNPQLSAFFEEVVGTLLEKEREKRFDDAAALRRVFEEGESSSWWLDRARAVRAATKRPLRRVRIPRETAVYGREDDLAKLRAAYGRAATGEGQLTLIEGEAGIGKTRLVDEFIAGLERDGDDVNVLFGSYPSGGAATASGAFLTAYRKHFGEAGLEGALADYLTATPLLVPAFAALLLGDIAPQGSQPLTKDSLQAVFVHVTRALAAERTTIVLIDDLHFASDEGRALFMTLAMAVGGHRVLLIGTHRPGLPEEWVAGATRLEQTSKMTLARLVPDDLVRLLGDSLGSIQLAEELTAKIAVKCDGNPFFVFEILRGLREEGFLKQNVDGTWTTSRVIDSIQIPSSVLDLVNARVAELDEEERDLLDAAACWGYEFDPTLIGNVCGLGPIPTLQRFGRIERRHRLVRSVGRCYTFDHHQVQEALYGALSEPLREAYHGALAETLETRTDSARRDVEELDGALCVSLCEHFLQGARGERALRYLDPAVAHFRTAHRHDRGIRLDRRALAVPGLLEGARRADVLLRLGTDLLFAGQPDEGRETFRQAIDVAETLEDPAKMARALLALGRSLRVSARYDDALDFQRRALDCAQKAGDRKTEGEATGTLGVVLYFRGHYAKARVRLERALELAREIGDARGEAAATGALASVATRQLRFDDAQVLEEEYLALARQIGDRRMEATAIGNAAVTHLEAGRTADALVLLERHLELARAIGDRQGEARALGNLAHLEAHNGRTEEALDLFRRYLTLSREIGHRRAETIAADGFGDLWHQLGRLDRSRVYTERALQEARELESRDQEASCKQRLGSVALAAGDAEEAERHFTDAVEQFRKRDVRAHLAAALLSLGALHREQGRTKSARSCLAEARDIAEGDQAHHTAWIAACHLSLLPDGEPLAVPDAIEKVEQRLGVAARMDARFILWQATAAPADLAEAHRLLQHLRDHAPQEYRDTMVENVPLHRDIAAAWAAQGGPTS